MRVGPAFQFNKKKNIIIYFHTSRVYKYKKGKEVYIIEITLLQGSVQKKLIFIFKKSDMICNKKYYSAMISEPSHA